MTAAPRHVVTVVPARNEEQHIESCLRSVHRATVKLRAHHPDVTAEAIVVLDRCSDRTGAVAKALGARTIRSTAGRVGSARRLGVERVQRGVSRRRLTVDDVWLANTDADTVVPDTWLLDQLDLAADGVDMVVGTVTPVGLAAAQEARWRAEHALVEGHSHVHGANLGVRLSTYLAAGGFADVAVHEDLDLVTRVRAATDAWIATHRTSVLTSARAVSRVDGGFADYIAGLGDSSCAS